MKKLLFILFLIPCFCFGQLTVTMTQTMVTCNGYCDGTATATPNGGPPPISYTWSNNATTASIVNLCPGTYTVTVIDAVPDTVIDSITVTEPLPLIVDSFLMTSVLCNGDCDGAVTVWISGGTGSCSYNWIPSGQTNATATALCAGTHCLEITDANNCTLDTCITVIQPTQLVINYNKTDPSGPCDGTINLNITGGTPGYSFLWSTGDTTQNLDSLCGGTYFVTVTDSNGCTAEDTITLVGFPPGINESESLDAISIHPNPTTGQFTVSSTQGAIKKVEVYDLYGRKVMATRETEIDMSNYPKGLYLLRMGDQSGRLVIE